MNAPKRRRGRPRKNARNPANNCSASKESYSGVGDGTWTALGSPYNLKIILKKIDARNSALVCYPNGVSRVSNEDFKILSPRLTLPRVDSITEQHISVSTIDNGEDGQSQQVYASYSKSVVCTPDMQSVVTESIYTVKAIVEDNSRVRRRSRRILKDVKNTSANREACTNLSGQRTLEGQENVHSMQGRIKSRFPVLTGRQISCEEAGNRSSEMIMERLIQANEIRGPVQLKSVALPSLGAPPAKRGRKRKSRINRKEPKEKIVCRRSPRSSSIVTRQRATGNNMQLTDTSTSEKNRCETIPSSKISQTSIERRVSDDASTQIIREEAALQFCSTSFGDQENVLPKLPKSPSTLRDAEIRVNIQTTKVHYSTKDKTVKKSEQQSFSFIGQRKWKEDDSLDESSECSAPKKRFFGNNCNREKRLSNNMNQCFVCIKRIQKIQQSPQAMCKLQQSNSSKSGIDLSIHETQPKPSTSYVTRHEASKRKESVDFYRIPWKQTKGIEKSNKNPDKSDVKASKNAKFAPLPWKTVKGLKNSNEKPAKSNVKENCHPVKPEAKRKNAKAEKKSSKTKPLDSYSCYRTRQKTTQDGESCEFYQLPWKKSTGFEIVTKKSKKVDIKTENEEVPTFKGWPKENVSVVLPTTLAQDAETSISNKGILKRKDLLASSTPFLKSSRRNANVSFASDIEGAAVNSWSPVDNQEKPSTSNPVFNGFPMRSCTVLLTCIPNPASKSPVRSKKRMTRREARQKAEVINKSKEASEVEAKYNFKPRSERSCRVVKRRVADKQINYRYSMDTPSSSEEEPEILVNRNKQNTPYVRLRKLNAADITSYKITPLKEDRIPKKSKTVDDYGIDDINTDDSTDSEEYPKKCIPQWAKNHENLPRRQSYLNLDLIQDWMKRPQFGYSLHHVFFSLKSHQFISTNGQAYNSLVPKQIRRRAVDYAAVSDFSNLPVVNETMENLPEEFDSRLQWPYCPGIGEISDQASCASCWAVSAVDAMSDRLCIHSKGKHKVRLSASNLINCCSQCGEGCSGGYYKPAWKYWTVHGLVSGGFYEGEGCQPYEFKPCEHLLVDRVPSCIKDGPTPPCRKACQSNYNVSYENDVFYGKSAYVIKFNEQAIKTEIYRNGPVQGSVKMYSDLYSYKTGVYEFDRKGHFIFHHAVRIIGWGVDNTTKVPYWLVANSFNRNWGEKGFFRIRRGSNECWIEEGVVAGLPKLSEN